MRHHTTTTFISPPSPPLTVGVPKEIKNNEYRVGLTPSSVRELTTLGINVYIESTAGDGIGFSDNAYTTAGATILPSAREVFDTADMIVKVKEPQTQEIPLLRPGQILFTYLHLASAPDIAKGLVTSGCTAVAYETIHDATGSLPLLTPMSQVAGRLAVQKACFSLEKIHGGKGVLLGGIAGVKPAKVVIVGGGHVGTQAALMASGMQAKVTILDKSVRRLQELAIDFGGKVITQYATQDALQTAMAEADVVIGSVLIPGAAAPKIIKRSFIAGMREGSVFVDVAIDQGGCSETSRPTSHDDPTYIEEGVIHYCVTNMPSLVAKTASEALNNATLPYVMALAQRGLAPMEHDPGFLAGLNVWNGKITCKPVMDVLAMDGETTIVYADPSALRFPSL